MKIALIGIAAVLLLAVLAVIAARRQRPGAASIPGYRRRDFLSKAEHAFFAVLQRAVGQDGLVFAKVRLADLLAPAAGQGSGGWQAAFNRIQSKHIDFVLCSLDDVVPRLAIELDDASHRQARRKERDQFLEAACQSAGLPLLRIAVHRDYMVRELREQIAPYLELGLAVDRHPTLELPAAAPPPAATPPPASRETTPPETTPALPPEPMAAPACPKCGAPMLRREGKSGALAGKAFWGCSNFPKCRGIA